MFRYLAGIAGIGAFLVGVISAPSQSRAVQTASIVGKVMSETGPVAGVVVWAAARIGPDNWGPAREVFSNDNGEFRFTRLAPGVYTLRAHKNGFVSRGIDRSGNFTVGPPSQPEVDIVCTAGLAFGPIEIHLARGGVITGKVVDEEGAPIAAIRVTALELDSKTGRLLSAGPADAQTRLTDDRGVYRIYGLNAGTYVVGANLIHDPRLWQKVVAVYSPDKRAPSDSQRVNVVAGTETTNVDVVVDLSARGSFSVAGTVVQQQKKGIGVNELKIALLKTDDPGLHYQTNTDAFGRYSFNGLSSGLYRIETRYSGESLLNARKEFRITDDDIGDLDIEMKERGTLSGFVVFIGGDKERPLSDVNIKLRSMTGAQLQCKLGKDGSFQATILSGEYDWSVSNPPEGVYLRAVLQNEADITCHRLTLDEEQSTTGVRLMFSRGAGTVKGQVANVRPRTAEKLVVHAIPVTIKKNPCAALHRFVVASPDGNFVLSGLAPGKYYLLVVPADEHASSNFADLESIARFIDGPSLKKKQRVRVQTGETVTNVRVVLALKAPEK